MKKIFGCFFIYIVTLFSHLAVADDGKLLFPGNVIGDHQKKAYKNFLALHMVNGNHFLTEAKVVYIPPNDGGDVGQFSSNVLNAIAYIKNRNLKSGEVMPANIDGSGLSAKEVSKKKMRISLGDKIYVTNYDGNSMVLSVNNIKQKIYPGRVNFYILWAGDMDKDGKLDFIVGSDDGDDKNTDQCLFLSSIAERGQLAREFECFSYGG